MNPELRAAPGERSPRQFAIGSLFDAGPAWRAARNDCRLRELCITVGKTADIVTGTICIARGHKLLHDDRGFAPMEEELGLRTLSIIASGRDAGTRVGAGEQSVL